MTCSFCITEDRFDVMTFAQAVHLLKYLRAGSIKTLVIGGGEPFAWPHDVVRLSESAKSLGFRTVQVGTNGIALPDGFERIVSIDRYVLPLESVRPEAHNRLRQYRDRHHATILDRLATLQAARKSVTISTVLTQVNRHDIIDVAEFLGEYNQVANNVHAWHLYQFIPLGRGGSVNAGQLEIPDREYRDLFESVRVMKLGFRVYRRSNMYRSRSVSFFWYEDGRIKTGSESWLCKVDR